MTKPSTFARIRALNAKQQVAFNLMLIERMLPNYQLYSEMTEFGDIKILNNVTDILWQWVCTPKFKIDVNVQQQKIEEVIPKSQESDGIGVFAAIDVAMALVSTLGLLEDSEYKNKEAVYGALISQGTIERMLIMSGDVEHSKAALEHPHMQWEIDSQNEYLDEVEKYIKISKADCNALKALAREEGVSNLGIEMTL